MKTNREKIGKRLLVPTMLLLAALSSFAHGRCQNQRTLALVGFAMKTSKVMNIAKSATELVVPAVCITISRNCFYQLFLKVKLYVG